MPNHEVFPLCLPVNRRTSLQTNSNGVVRMTMYPCSAQTHSIFAVLNGKVLLRPTVTAYYSRSALQQSIRAVPNLQYFCSAHGNGPLQCPIRQYPCSAQWQSLLVVPIPAMPNPTDANSC